MFNILIYMHIQYKDIKHLQSKTIFQCLYICLLIFKRTQLYLCDSPTANKYCINQVYYNIK